MSLVDAAKAAAMKAQQAAIGTAVQLAPARWLPGGTPDPLIRQRCGHIGQPVPRVDGSLKVKGEACFAAEYTHDGLVYAAVVFSTVATGRIVALDTAAAEHAEGVMLVMTYHNAPRLAPMPRFFSNPLAAGNDDLPVLQDDRIHWNGQPIALVLAETQEQADHAAALIVATYASADDGDAVTDFAAAKRRGTAPGSFAGQPLQDSKGDAEAALKAAAVTVDRTYTSPAMSHNAMETHAVTAQWDGDRLVVNDASQGVVHAAWSLAQVFGIEQEQVRVTSPFVGGGSARRRSGSIMC